MFNSTELFDGKRFTLQDVHDRIDELNISTAEYTGDLDELDELEALNEFIDEYNLAGLGEEDVLFIPDEDFSIYAQEVADSLELIDHLKWPHNCIDWERAAETLKHSYTYVENRNHTYWFCM